MGCGSSSCAATLDRPATVTEEERPPGSPAHGQRVEVVEMFRPAPKVPVDVSSARMANRKAPPAMASPDPAAPLFHPGVYAGAVDVKAWEMMQRQRNYQPVP